PLHYQPHHQLPVRLADLHPSAFRSPYFQCSVAPHVLHSFPTRRSSDLSRVSSRVSRFQIGKIAVIPIRARFFSRYSRRSSRKISDRKSTRLNSSHGSISYAVFCLKKKNSLDPDTHRA